MTWSAETIIYTVFIPLYAVLLVANVYNCYKHGATRVFGYVFLVFVSVFKITGNVMTVVINTSNSTNIALITWGLILSQLGFYPLLSASMSFIRRWINNWEGVQPGLNRYNRALRLLHLLILGGVTCSILGGVWSSPTDPNINTGYTLRRVGTILFTASVLAILILIFLMKDKSQSREQRADPVLLQLFIVLPIMLVRILYATSQAFKSTPQNPTHNTWVYLVLLMIPDFISDAVYTYFGAVILRSFKHSGPSKGQPSSEYGKMSSSQTQQPAYQEPPY